MLYHPTTAYKPPKWRENKSKSGSCNSRVNAGNTEETPKEGVKMTEDKEYRITIGPEATIIFKKAACVRISEIGSLLLLSKDLEIRIAFASGCWSSIERVPRDQEAGPLDENAQLRRDLTPHCQGL